MLQDAEQCWEAVERRDAAQDGRFVFGVVTTGVYCRPSCPSRRPLRRNVRFYATAGEARRDGLRACLRCRPDEAEDPRTHRIRDLCRYIEEHCDETLTLEDLGRRAGLSPFHLQRTFREVVGATPREYAEVVRMGRLKRGLRSAAGVADAVYEAGYGSSSRVYERAPTRLGMTPGQYREGGRGVEITYAEMATPLGPMLVGATDRGLCFVEFGDSREELLAGLTREYPAARIEPMREPQHPEFHRWVEALRAHLAGARPQLDLPLDIRGTAFQWRVWNYLQSIPYGEVQSYSEVARAIGQPRAARAVGTACAGNPVALAIPCHRVIRGSGDLGGYRWGLPRKRALLDRERKVKAART